MTAPFANQVALVTGASRGIGAAVARALGAQGAHVILAARTVGGLEEVDDAIQAAGGSASIVPVDLRQHELIDSLAAHIYERWGKLDMLVGNAGVLGSLTPVAHADPKVWQQIMDVNVTANYRLIRALDPLLRRSDAGRAVFITSDTQSDNLAYWGPYAASKAALDAMVRAYAAEVEGGALKVNLVDPGVVRTAMRAAAFPGENTEGLATPDQVADRILAFLRPDCTSHGIITRAA